MQQARDLEAPDRTGMPLTQRQGRQQAGMSRSGLFVAWPKTEPPFGLMPGGETAVGRRGFVEGSFVISNLFSESYLKCQELLIVRDILGNLVVTGQPGYGDGYHRPRVLLLEEGCKRLQQKGFETRGRVRDVCVHL
jgi:hypothetical protein